MFGALRKLLLVGIPLAALTFAPAANNEAKAQWRRGGASVWVNPGGVYVGTYPRFYGGWYGGGLYQPYGGVYSSYYYAPTSYYTAPVYSYGYSYYGYPYATAYRGGGVYYW